MHISKSNDKSERNFKTNEIPDSETKRLQSLKQKKQAFKKKERLIRDALNNLDNKPKSNKIVFDEDFGEREIVEFGEPRKKQKKKGTQLFDDDNNDENELADFQIDIDKDERLAKMPSALEYDPRFTLDERFAEDNEKDEDNMRGNGESDLKDEKEWQLNILGNVLGAPVIARDKKQPPTKKAKMIRYDPTATEHKEYEVTKEDVEPELKKSRKKRKKDAAEEVQEAASIEVSKDIFYSVSDALTNSLKQEEQFSLLKTYGKGENNTENANPQPMDVESVKDARFKFSFEPRGKVFKYDSSDDENTERQTSAKTANTHKFENKNDNNTVAKRECFFFEEHDARFNDAIKFLHGGFIPSLEEFKARRRELKQIVRKKIRSNEKKRQPWGKVKRRIKK